jgi:ribosomal protein L31E
MPSVTVTPKKTVRSKRRPKAISMTKLEMVQKMLADQKIIGEALQKGISLKKLEKSHGYHFARL